jgi:pyruvate formate lyase activating enzyme
MSREAVLYQPLDGGRVRCTACNRYCNIPEGKIGLCGIRKNIAGRLHLLVYGRIIAGNLDPIEKKPIMHYRPGTQVYSIATTGCNWLCSYCQNYDISQRRKVEGWEVTPEEVVATTIRVGGQGIAYTYNEPTIFVEFAHDVGVIARRRGLYNCFVSNGYMTLEAIDYLADFLDAITVDFKGNGEPGFMRRYIGVAGPEPIFESLLALKKKVSHVEVTDLVVPEIGDSLEWARRLARWVYDNLGPETPLHFLRFHPDYKLSHLPWTPIETLEAHWKVGKEAGLHYVYLGNVPGHPYEHTYCPGCGRVVVRRLGFDILEWRLVKDNRCPDCGFKIAIKGVPPQASAHMQSYLH